MNKIPTVLCILDGFGLNSDGEANAIKLANTPNFNTLWNSFPHQQLITHGERVGLPAGQMGNSEVGHLNIGAGRVVSQWLTRISLALRQDQLPKIAAYQQFVSRNMLRTVHLIGLVSDGGVHAHVNHLLKLIQRLRKDIAGEIVIHAITDGRDTGEKTGIEFVRTIETYAASLESVSIGTVVGRFYAMDRDKRWDRIEKAYRALVEGAGVQVTASFSQAVKESYDLHVTDEFIEPITAPNKHIHPNDAAVFFNFREDRMREIVQVLTQSDLPFHFPQSTVLQSEQVLCFTEYDSTYELPFLFKVQTLDDHLGETVSKQGATQLRIAETEKYPHVTYFMNGKVENPYQGEERVLVPSPREVTTYDEKPEMSAQAVLAAAIDGITSNAFDFIVINFANCDMVGHTGNLLAATIAVETVDTCIGDLVSAVQKQGGNLVVIADHGNAEQMIDYATGLPLTSHTTYPVPIIIARFDGSHSFTIKDDGALCDVAPTLLELMHLTKPTLMSGKSLLVHKND